MIYCFAAVLFIGSNALSPPDKNLNKPMRVLDAFQQPKDVDKDNNSEFKCDRGNYVIFYMTPHNVLWNIVTNIRL